MSKRGYALVAGAAALVAPLLAADAASAGPACYRKVFSPPVYGIESERVSIVPEQRYIEIEPAEYGVVAERTVISPAHRAWAWRRIDGVETLCAIEVPAVYGTRYRQVVLRPAQIVRTANPAQSRLVHHRELLSPASVSWEPVEDGCP